MSDLIAVLSTGICIYCTVLFLLGRKSEALQAQLNAVERLGKDTRETGKRYKGFFLTRALRSVLGSLIARIGAVLPVSARDKERISLLMYQSGLNMKPEEYIALQFLLMGGGGLVGVYYGFATGGNMLLCAGIGVYTFYALMRFSSSGKAARRKEKIGKQFPELLDLLSISVEAGLGFNQAMQYITEQCEGPLVEEFQVTVRSMGLGQSRRTALEEMTYRCGLDEISIFVGAVIQADELGISLKNILNAQAKEIRNLRRMKTEEKAQKIPIKMLLPLAVFIFPVMMIIIMGPAIPKMMSMF